MTHRPRINRPESFLLQTLVLLAACAVVASPALGQFGKNRIQYRQFGEWKIYHSPHFDVHYYEDEAPLLEKTVSFAESAYDELSREFDFQIQDPTPLIVYRTHSAFLQNNIILNGVPEGAVAFAVPSRFRMVLPLDLPDPDLLALIKHELTHIFQYHILFRGKLVGGLRGGPPQWFMEGMASYYGDDESPSEKKFIRDAVVNDEIPSVLMQGGGYFAYRFGHAVFDFIEERWGRETIVDLLYEVRNTLGANIGRAIERVFRMDVEDFDSEFRRWLRKKYLTELVQTGEPGDFGKPFRLEPGVRGQELSPVASPSGDLVAALSTDKGEVDVSLFDANKRRRIRVLTRGFDKKIEQFVISSTAQPGSDLAFSPDGNYIAAFGRRESYNSLVLIDVINGGIHRIIDMEVEQARAPAWHPDGGSIVFSGNLNGRFDLFSIDLDTFEITNVTDDEIYETAPAFSPDGKWLAYTAWVGEHTHLFRLDTSDPSKRYALTTGEHNNKEAVFSRDGKRIYFTSDRSGADNIYGLDLENRQITQYTNAVTSCDRPTVLPLPEGGERLVYNGYWKRAHDLYMTDVDEPIAPPEPSDFEGVEPVVTAELPKFEPAIEVTLDEANVGKYGGFKFFLEDATTFAGLSTNNIFVGRVLLSFSDYLGDRRILTNVAAVDSFSDFDVIYADLSRRWQWTARASDQRFFAVLGDPFTGQIVDRAEVYRLTSLEGNLIYPLSLKRRFEFGLSFQLREFNFNAFVFDSAGNAVQIIEPRDDTIPEISAAFVSDTALFSPWGAIGGHRVRIGGSWAPDLDDSGTLESRLFVDARKYIPVTRRSNWAFRLVAVEADGNFPLPSYIGGLDTLRGFDFRQFGGTRTFFANIEFRFPLIDQLALPGLRFQGIRGVFFLDVGAAYFPDVDNGFNFFDSENGRLDGGVASFGYGFTIRFLGFNLNFDFAKQWDFEQSLTGFESAFWIGTRF
ncbi:MAG: hypothetical protein D6696_18670 [Acidobacteria bacterium]|nr:MAG: hypothetical protein D6696_18670 [Acidobacteriota bacterium]